MPALGHGHDGGWEAFPTSPRTLAAATPSPRGGDLCGTHPPHMPARAAAMGRGRTGRARAHWAMVRCAEHALRRPPERARAHGRHKDKIATGLAFATREGARAAPDASEAARAAPCAKRGATPTGTAPERRLGRRTSDAIEGARDSARAAPWRCPGRRGRAAPGAGPSYPCFLKHTSPNTYSHGGSARASAQTTDDRRPTCNDGPTASDGRRTAGDRPNDQR